MLTGKTVLITGASGGIGSEIAREMSRAGYTVALTYNKNRENTLYIVENNIKVYNEKTLKGSVRHIVIRIGKKTNEVMVTLVVNKLFEKQEELIKGKIKGKPFPNSLQFSLSFDLIL